MQSIDNLADGTRVRVTFEGTVGVRRRPSGGYAKVINTSLGGHSRAFGSETLRAAKEIATLAPVWQPGDVVVVRYYPQGAPYTYVRGARVWPGERAASKSDSEIDALFEEGKVEHVLRDGKPVEKVSASDKALTELRERLTAEPAPTATDFFGHSLRVGDVVRSRVGGGRGAVQRVLTSGLVEFRASGTSVPRRTRGDSLVRIAGASAPF